MIEMSYQFSIEMITQVFLQQFFSISVYQALQIIFAL